MAKDVRALREEAAEATASGKYKRALAAYLELERLDPRDAQWAKRAGETYRRLGNNKHAIEAFERSADRYAQNGFLVQAIAVCKLVLQIDPQHASALRRLAAMNEQLGAGPTRVAGMAENNPALHENPNVNAIRRSAGQTVNPRAKLQSNRPVKESSGRVPVMREGLGAGSGSTEMPAARAPTAGGGAEAGKPAAGRTSTPAAGLRARTEGDAARVREDRADAVVRAPGVQTPTPARGVTPGAAPAGAPSRPPIGTGATTRLPRAGSAADATPTRAPTANPAPTTNRAPVVAPRATTHTPEPQTTPIPRASTAVPDGPAAMPAKTRAPTPMPDDTPRPTRTTPSGPVLSRTRSPNVAMPRTKSKPISLPPGAALDQVRLAAELPEAQLRDESQPGIHVIPLEHDYAYEVAAQPGQENVDTFDYERVSAPIIEVEPPDVYIDAEVVESTELELDDIEEIPLPEPLYMGAAAHKALQSTPLFAGLTSEALEALVENLTLVHLEPNEVLFREGEPGDALYVIVEGEVSVQAEGPPRVEMSRLGAGSFIGEVALMTDQPRSATVSAVAAAELLRIDRHTLSRVLANHGDVLRAVLRFVRDRLVDRWMRTSPLFRPFDDEQRAELAAKFNFLEIEDGTRLIEAGSRPDGLYIVLAGQFAVDRDDATVAMLGAGELIGETALLSGSEFKSNISARGKALALHLPAGEFREIIMTHPHVLEYIGEHAEHSRRLHIL